MPTDTIVITHCKNIFINIFEQFYVDTERIFDA